MERFILIFLLFCGISNGNESTSRQPSIKSVSVDLFYHPCGGQFNDKAQASLLWIYCNFKSTKEKNNFEISGSIHGSNAYGMFMSVYRVDEIAVPLTYYRNIGKGFSAGVGASLVFFYKVKKNDSNFGLYPHLNLGYLWKIHRMNIGIKNMNIFDYHFYPFLRPLIGLEIGYDLNSIY